MPCPNCGGALVGDSYTTVIHCEFTDPEGLEPDANPHYCGAKMPYLLQNWSVTACPRDPYLAPELRSPCLQGKRDGNTIITSWITGKTPEGFICTQNSIYQLGNVDPAYEVQFPNAEQRLLDSLSCIKPDADLPIQ